MAETKNILKFYSLSHPLVATEMISILGDKYRHALSFDFISTDNIQEASVIAWDGVISVKLKSMLPELLKILKAGKVLLLMGEAQTLLENHPLVEVFKASAIPTIQLTGWTVTPEEIIAAFEDCYKKSVHV